ncbi:unnamed protein product [Nippostrongylus brasiliensis]|uniref:CACTA en-spm transposon protein n=1 Tax=Nippostrongylus brasiliensis TaxID=27835 RepID=A0A0N4YPC7_NIPBR|nr:unnamed protein product [Nippostrongylus brasiliensis]
MSELAERVGNRNSSRRQRGEFDSQHMGHRDFEELMSEIHRGGNAESSRASIHIHRDFEELMSGLKQTYLGSSSSSAPTPNRRKVGTSPSPAPRVGPPVAAKSRVVAMDRDRQ